MSHGGPRQGAGQPPVGGKGTQTVMYKVRLSEAQHAKVLALGGARWVRGQIDQALTPETAKRD